jgi:hypothetical protein
MRRTLLLLFVMVTGSRAQRLSFGIMGGGALSDAFRREVEPAGFGPISTITGITFFSEARDLVAGATLELHLNPRWSIEADGLHRQLHMTWAAVLQDGTLNSVSPSPVVTWEFPVLAKYRFTGPRFSPFIEAGPSFRTTGNLNGANPSHVGAALGAGVETRLGNFRVAPTIRYTRWRSDTNPFGPRTRPGQIELLASITHDSEARFHPLGRRVSLGVIAGMRLTGDVGESPSIILVPIPQPDGSYTYRNDPATVKGVRSALIGPSIEVAIAGGISVEAGALYHPLRSQLVTNSGAAPGSGEAFAITWELPLLAKYRFPVRTWRAGPFVELGPSFRLPQQAGGTDLATRGVTAGAGVETRFRGLAISPAVRFTHWGPDAHPGWSGIARNQASLLLSLAF